MTPELRTVTEGRANHSSTNPSREKMRVLFLTNFYMAQRTGGEDQSCQRVVDGLRQRGHTTLVLTSMDGTNNVPEESDGVDRALYLEMDLEPWRHSVTFFTKRKARERHNLRHFERVLEKFAPDIIFIWGMWNLPRSLAAFAEASHPDKVIYRFATYWPTLPSQHELYWRAPGRKWYSRHAKQVLGRVALAMLAREDHQPRLKFKHAICVSGATRKKLVEAGLPVADARVIHTGIDATSYLHLQRDPALDQTNQDLNLLYAGRLVEEKGVDTAILALQKLVSRDGLRRTRLTLAGSESADYESHLRHMVLQAGLDAQVTFLGHVPAEEMPQLLTKFDVLLVPSLWPEPFSRMILEGMSSGLVVVATPSGGTPEILTDGENGLLFAPGDADDLAGCLRRLAADPALRRRLAQAGRQTIMDRWTETAMMDEIEGYLRKIAATSARQSAKQLN